MFAWRPSFAVHDDSAFEAFEFQKHKFMFSLKKTKGTIGAFVKTTQRAFHTPNGCFVGCLECQIFTFSECRFLTIPISNDQKTQLKNDRVSRIY